MSTPPVHRRTLLRAVALGGAAVTAKSLPETWTRPLVQATLLPAHAQATALAGGIEFSTAIVVSDTTGPHDHDGAGAIASLRRGWMDRALPRAHAQVSGRPTTVSLRSIEGSPDRFDVRVIVEFNADEFDISLFERANVSAGSFVEIDFLYNTMCNSGFVDQCRIRVQSISPSVITGDVEVNDLRTAFEATPGPWPPRPSPEEDCDVGNDE